MRRFVSLRRVGILLLALTMVMCLAISASAATITQDGIQVTVTTDKDKYEANEKITPSITVENRNDFDIKDVKVDVSVPGDYEVTGDQSVTYATLKAGENKRATVTIAAKPADKASAGVATPIFLLLLAAAVLVGVIIFFRKGNKKIVTVFLAVIMVVGMIPVVAFAADTTRSMTVTGTVAVGTGKADIMVTVTYTIHAQKEDPTDSTTAPAAEATTESTTAPTTDIDVVNPNAIYVSAAAKAGEGDGSFENPYANIHEAKAAIRIAKANGEYPEEGITVYFREGQYYVLDTVVLTEEDSGKEGAPVIYSAYKGEKVEFIGGINIDASQFTAVTDTAILNRLDPTAQSNIKQFDLKSVGITEYGQMHVYGMAAAYFRLAGVPIQDDPAPNLYFNNELMQIAKYPDGDEWAKIFSIIQYGDVIQNWNRSTAHGSRYVPPEKRPPIDQIENSIFTVDKSVTERMQRWTDADDIWVYGWWEVDYSDQSMPVKSITVDDKGRGTIETGIPSGKRITAGRRFYFYNLLEEITAPGEYYLDRNTGILYAYLPSETGAVTYGSLVGSTIHMYGVHNIEIVGIDFIAGTENAILVEDSQNILIQKCEMSNFSNVGVQLYDCRDVTVTGCHIYDTGSGGVTVGYDTKSEPYATAVKNLDSLGILIENCDIHDYSMITKTYSAGVATSGIGMVVRNCKIYNADHYAISLRGNDTLIENCEFFNVLRTSADSGVIYDGFNKQEMGQIVRNNFFHDIGSSAGKDVSCIYMDDTKDGVTFESNLLVNIGGRGFFMNGGWDNIARNNVMINVNAEGTLGDMGMGGTLRYDILEGGNYARFLEVYRDPENYPGYLKYPHWEGKLETLLSQPYYNAPRYNTIENNILVNVKNPVKLNCTRGQNTVALMWQNNAIEYGTDYTLDAVGFVDYKNGNFNFKADSAVLAQLGEKAPDYSKMGLYGVGCEKPKGFGGDGYDGE